MGLTIISNNCSGARLQQDLRMQYQSPTIILQILPEEYPKFCMHLKHYMDAELKEYKEFSEIHHLQMVKLLGQEPYFPCGIIDDVAVLFQHYETFEEAKEKWERRKARMDYDHIGYMFVLEKPYIVEAMEFGNLPLKNSVLFTRGFDVDVPIEHHRYDLPEGTEYLQRDPRTGFRYFEYGFNRKKFLEGITNG